MRFVKTDDLKAGMRLAKPIYNKNGVLLYDRNTKLTPPGITSIRNFNLVGIYVLEPAEPVPPLSREDIEFEQLQTVYMFKLRECVDLVVKRKKMDPLFPFLQDIVKHYGALDHRVNFNQNLRSGEDFMYKHALSTAILTAMITKQLGYTAQKQLTVVCAALLYDIGYRSVPMPVLEKGPKLTQGDKNIIQQALENGLELLSMYRNDYEFFPRALALMQSYVYADHEEKMTAKPDDDMKFMVQLLRVADQFDQMTAMNIGHAPVSEIEAMRCLNEDPLRYDPSIVDALAKSIHIVPVAASVDLSTGDKAIVLVENPNNFMRPVILRLSDNTIYDLSHEKVFREIQITDIMKTMDNRIQIDEETLKHFIPDEELIKLTTKFREGFRKARAADDDFYSVNTILF